MLSIAVVLLISYLIGSIPSSLWVGKLVHKIDIREHGSGNAGATNTFRVMGWKSGTVVVVMDFIKGFSATFWISQIAYYFDPGPVSPPNWEVDAFLRIICGVAAMGGHIFPLYAGFKGGKGALTAAGMLYGIEPISISISIAVFLILLFTTRYVSLASVISTFIYPLNLIVLRYLIGWFVDGSNIIFASVAALGILLKHIPNMKRLLTGTENRISSFSPSKGKIPKE